MIALRGVRGSVMVASTAAMPRFYLLGSPRLELPCGSVVPIHSRKGIALLAMLATSDRGERSRVWLQQMLWGSRPQRQAQSSLRRELANLKKTLHDARLDVLRSEQRVVRLMTGQLWIDVHNLDGPSAARSDFLEGIDIAGEEEFEDWLREMRSRMIDLHEGGTAQPAIAAANARPATLPAAVVMLPAIDTTGSVEGREVADRLTQTLVELLPRLRWLPIIPAGIVAAQSAEPGGNLHIAERLGARYVLQTDVFTRDAGLAANFTMLEMPGQIIRWSETRTIGSDLDDAALRSDAARVVNCIGETFDLSEQRHAFALDVEEPDFAQLTWKIRFHINQFTRSDFDKAERLIETALARHSSHSELLMLRANLALWQHWIARASNDESARIAPLIRAAMRADPADARGPLFSGILETWHRRGGQAIQHLTRACTLDPSSAQAFSHLGAAHYLSGDPRSALAPLEHALFLAPLDPKRFHTIGQLATVLWMLGRCEEALDKTIDIQTTHPGYVLAHVIETACLVELGRSAEASRARQRIVRGKSAKYRAMLDWMPFADAGWNERLRHAIAPGEPLESRSAPAAIVHS